MRVDIRQQVASSIKCALEHRGIPVSGVRDAERDDGWYGVAVDYGGTDLHFSDRYPVEWAEKYPMAMTELFVAWAEYAFRNRGVE